MIKATLTGWPPGEWRDGTGPTVATVSSAQTKPFHTVTSSASTKPSVPAKTRAQIAIASVRRRRRIARTSRRSSITGEHARDPRAPPSRRRVRRARRPRSQRARPGRAWGRQVSGTPTLFIDGVFHRGGYDAAELLEALAR